MPAASPPPAAPRGAPSSAPRPEPATGTAIVIDVSGSMHAVDDGGTQRRIDRLTGVLRDVLRDAPAARVVAFGSQVGELVGLEPGPALALPEPGGSTPLAEALELVATWAPRPGRIVVLSDGMPDDGTKALAVARTLKPAIVSALYVGPDGHKTAIAFMKALALMGGRGGISGHRSLAGPAATKALADEVTLLLTGPQGPLAR